MIHFVEEKEFLFFYDKENELVTTVGQLNFFRWAIENNILEYIHNHLKEIEIDMNTSVRSLYSKRNKSKKNNKKSVSGDESKKQRRKRQELSVNATKSISKHNVKILVKFE